MKPTARHPSLPAARGTAPRGCSAHAMATRELA